MHVFIVVKYAEHEINHFSRFYRHSGITCIHTFSKNRLPLFLLLLQAFCFRLCWVFLAASRLAAAVALRRLVAAASGCGAGSPAPARQLGLAGSELRRRGCGARASLLRGARTLPGPGVKPVCAALAGGFSPAAPLGKLLSAFKIRPFAQQFFSFPT